MTKKLPTLSFVGLIVVGLMAMAFTPLTAKPPDAAGANAQIVDDAFPTTSDVVTTLGPQMSTRVLMVYDSDNNGLGGPSDMAGPRMGFTFYAQNTLGGLGLAETLVYAWPNTTYHVFLTCGPSHAMACGFIDLGTVTTNANGRGTTSKSVPLATLRTAPFGCGYRTDHVDLLQTAGDLSKGFLTSGAINYFVPCAAGTSPAAPTTPTGPADPSAK